MTSPETVVYRIDAEDRITFVNAEWDSFASTNSGQASREVIQLSLWDFISDATTRHLYRAIVKRIREGHRIQFPFRCDAPDCRRYMQMEARLLEDNAIEFRTRIVSVEPRPSQALLDPKLARTSELMRICSWCAKIEAGGAWEEIESAVAKLKLFDSPALPLLTHGICPKCEAAMTRTLSGA